MVLCKDMLLKDLAALQANTGYSFHLSYHRLNFSSTFPIQKKKCSKMIEIKMSPVNVLKTSVSGFG